LVTFREGSRSKQWLTEFRIAMPTKKEIADNPQRTVTLSTENGHTYRFGTGVPLALDIHTVGPFTEGQKLPEIEKHARVFISPDFLGLGLERSCRAMIKWRAKESSTERTKREPKGAMIRLGVEEASAVSTKDTSASGPKTAILSEEDERDLSGSGPALVGFFEGVQNTPGLREILWEIADKPSIWSVIKHGGKVNASLKSGSDFALVEPAGWVLPGLSLSRFPINIALNETPTLRCTLLVTSPRPPLLTCAGIIGIAAEPPGNSDKRLDIRIIAAHRLAP
jgi:hypothetical protein